MAAGINYVFEPVEESYHSQSVYFQNVRSGRPLFGRKISPNEANLSVIMFPGLEENVGSDPSPGFN